MLQSWVNEGNVHGRQCIIRKDADKFAPFNRLTVDLVNPSVSAAPVSVPASPMATKTLIPPMFMNVPIMQQYSINNRSIIAYVK